MDALADPMLNAANYIYHAWLTHYHCEVEGELTLPKQIRLGRRLMRVWQEQRRRDGSSPEKFNGTPIVESGDDDWMVYVQ